MIKKLYSYLSLGTCTFLIWYFPIAFLSAKKSSSRIGGCFTLQIEPGEEKERSLTLPAQSILRLEIPFRSLPKDWNWHVTVPIDGVLTLKSQGVSTKRKRQEKGRDHMTFLEFKCGSSGYSEVFWSYINSKQKRQNSTLRVEIMPRSY